MRFCDIINVKKVTTYMVKKIFTVFILLVTVFASAGCGNTQNEPSDEVAQGEQESVNTQIEPIDENLKERLLSDTFSPTPFSDIGESEAPLSDEEMRAIISKIPSDKYEVYPKTHTIPVSATLYKNGEVISVSVDDPRLIRLTNFFNNCVYYSKCSYLQGLLSLDHIEEILSVPFRLELNYLPYGNPASPYGKETTGSDMFIVTTTFTMIDHSRHGYAGGNYPFYATGFSPLYRHYNLLELFGF